MSNPTNDIALSKPSSSSSEPQKRRKRCRTCERPGWQNPTGEKAPSPKKALNFVGLCRNCSIHGYEENKLLQELQSKGSSSLVKNCDQMARKRVFKTRRNFGNEGEEEAKVDDFFTEIDDAITIIESLIPALQKLVSSDPTNHEKGVGILTLPNLCSLNADTHLPITIGRSEECKCKEIKLSNKMSTQSMSKPLNWVWTQNRSQLEKNLQDQRSRTAGVKTNALISKNGSVKSQASEYIQGFRIMPCLFNKDNPNQNQMIYREANVKNAVLGTQASVGSTNFLRPNRISNLGNSDCKLSQCHTRESTVLEKSRSSKKIQYRDGANRSKILVLSESNPSSSGTYQSTSSGSVGSYESEVQYGNLGQSSRRKKHGASESNSTSGYDTSAYNNSQACSSDVTFSSQSSPAWSQDHDLERAKRAGRFMQLKKKLGMIFHHHHHHHHHHYSGSDESAEGHGGSFWRHIGKMFHQKRKSDREKPKIDKSRKAVITSVPNKKQQGHFRGLVQALMRHSRHSKKSKKAKDNFVRLGNSRHRGRKVVNRLPWWPRICKGKGGVKVSNKGRLKLKNRNKKFPLAAAKMILQE